jgi:hypothetical protein
MQKTPKTSCHHQGVSNQETPSFPYLPIIFPLLIIKESNFSFFRFWFLPLNLAIQLFLFAKTGAIVLGSVHIRK